MIIVIKTTTINANPLNKSNLIINSSLIVLLKYNIQQGITNGSVANIANKFALTIEIVALFSL